MNTLGRILLGAALGACAAALYVMNFADTESQLELSAAIVSEAASDRFRLLSITDPAQAAETALALELSHEQIATAFSLWAESDPDAAIARVASISESAALRQRIALAILEALGGSERTLERLASVLPASDAMPLRMEWLAAHTEIDPHGALSAAMAIDDPLLQLGAIETVATAWAARDPVGALAAAERLSASLATAFRQQLVIEWAKLDRAGYAAWLQSLAQPDETLLQGMEYLALSDPEWVINTLVSISGTFAQGALSAAIGSLTQTDLEAATEILENTASGQARDRMAQRIVLTIADSDPAAAVEWLDRIDSPPPTAISALALDMATSDYALMLDLADRLPANDFYFSITITTSTINAISRHPDQMPEYADLLLVREDGASRQMLGRVAGDWLEDDADAALGWLQTHSEALSPDTLSMAASRIADDDHLAAAEFANRIPSQLLSGWVVRTAAAYGSADADEAAAWVAQYRSQDYYVPAMAEIIFAAAEENPSDAAALLERHVASEDVRRQIRERIDALNASPFRR